MATDNSLQIKITADVADAQKALTSISKLSKTAKSSLDMLGSSALGVSNAFAKLGGTAKELNAFKSMGKSNFLGLKTAQKDILNTQKAIEKLGKKGVSVSKDIEKSFNKAFKSLDKMSKNGTIKIRVEEPKSKKESNNDNNRDRGNKAGGVVGAVIGAYSGAIGNKVFREIAHLQEKRARVSAWNLSKAQQKIWDRQVRQLLKDNSLITEADAESMMMAAASSIGHYDPHIVGQTVASATKYAQMERAMGYNKSNIDDIAKNYYGVAEARQVANDVEKTLKTFETVFRITTTSSGKITVADVETILRNLGPGAATLSDEGLLRLLAYAEQIKVAGRGQSGSTGAGISTVGTTTKMLQLMAMGKPSALGAKRMIAELGIMDDEVYRIVGDRVELALENVSEQAEKKNADERAIAREIFERGEFGQVLGKYVIGSDLARAGVYDKQLAQTDPVKWVQNLMPLIKQYTASKEKRGSYYGQKGLEAGDMKTEEFMKTLNESDYLSAITSFWARTGLSQRVINAFSIFSNEAFQHRSAAMLQTAVNQKDVTALQLEQIENGNLNIAFLKAQTSLNNFIQAFEPFGAIVGKATYYLSGFLDILGQWARDYPFLSNFLASWGALKTAQLGGRSFLEFYGYLNDNKKKTGGQEASKKRRKSSSAKDTPSNASDAKKADNNQAVPYFVGLENRAKKASTNIKNAFANMIPKIASLFNKIGFYGMLGGFAYTLADMTIEYLGWGDKFRSWWDSIVSFVNENPLSLSLRFDQNKYRSKEDNQRIADIDKEIAEREDYNASRRQSDDLSLEEMKQMSENETRIKALKAERKTLSTRTSTTIGQLKPLLQSVEGVFKDKKYLENVQKFVDANAKLGDTVKQFNTQSDYFKTYISDEQKGEGKDAQSAFDTAYGNLKDQTKQTTDAFDEVKKSLVFEGEDLDKIQRFEDAVNSLSGMGDQLEPIATNLSQLMSVMLGFDVDSDYVSYMIKNKKFSVQGIANSRVFDLENQAAAQQAMSRDYYEQGAKRKYRQSTPDIVPGATLNDVASYAEKIKKDLTKASAVSSQRYAFDTDEEVMKQARATVLSDVMAGKLGADFKEWTSFYFKDNVDEAALKRGGYTNEEDYNFNRKVNGYSLNDLTKLQAQKLRLSKYNSTFGSLGIQSEDMRLESQRNLARAQASTTAVGEAGLPDQSYQTSVWLF